ncbi:DUF6640 family protein [Streptomyces lydicamycinicus]|uniref:DUF6640 family protein n=1 Tax=Streptomyces lydicamycinicus TaxID=1546107 RepID=UPI003C2E44C9
MRNSLSSTPASGGAPARSVIPSRAVIGKAMLSLVAVFTGVSPYIADWNETHVLNPLWPAHAKFHNGQTMAMGTLLALATLYFVWRRRGDAGSNLRAAVVLAGLYWVSQALAIFYPGAAYFDPQFDKPDMYVAGLPVQAVIEIVALALIGGAVLLSRPAPGSGVPENSN